MSEYHPESMEEQGVCCSSTLSVPLWQVGRKIWKLTRKSQDSRHEPQVFPQVIQTDATAARGGESGGGTALPFPWVTEFSGAVTLAGVEESSSCNPNKIPLAPQARLGEHSLPLSSLSVGTRKQTSAGSRSGPMDVGTQLTSGWRRGR